MNPIQLILIAIRGLSVLTNNPALGGGSSVKLQETSKLLNFLGELLERGDEAHTELKEFADTVKAMADENRAPTPAEWDALKARSDAAHSIIQEAMREAEAEEEANAPPEPDPEPEPVINEPTPVGGLTIGGVPTDIQPHLDPNEPEPEVP